MIGPETWIAALALSVRAGEAAEGASAGAALTAEVSDLVSPHPAARKAAAKAIGAIRLRILFLPRTPTSQTNTRFFRMPIGMGRGRRRNRRDTSQRELLRGL